MCCGRRHADRWPVADKTGDRSWTTKAEQCICPGQGPLRVCCGGDCTPGCCLAMTQEDLLCNRCRTFCPPVVANPAPEGRAAKGDELERIARGDPGA